MSLSHPLFERFDSEIYFRISIIIRGGGHLSTVFETTYSTAYMKIDSSIQIDS